MRFCQLTASNGEIRPSVKYLWNCNPLPFALSALAGELESVFSFKAILVCAILPPRIAEGPCAGALYFTASAAGLILRKPPAEPGFEIQKPNAPFRRIGRLMEPVPAFRARPQTPGAQIVGLLTSDLAWNPGCPGGAAASRGWGRTQRPWSSRIWRTINLLRHLVKPKTLHIRSFCGYYTITCGLVAAFPRPCTDFSFPQLPAERIHIIPILPTRFHLKKPQLYLRRIGFGI